MIVPKRASRNNVNANDRNVGNDNIQAPPRNENNEPPQEGQGFLEMLNIRLVIKIAFFYMVFSQDQSKRHKTFLFVALAVYYFYCVGLLHFLLRAVTCGRHGRQANANNNENNQMTMGKRAILIPQQLRQGIFLARTICRFHYRPTMLCD